jgi:alkylated DNA repair dioxygenase AlkB
MMERQVIHAGNIADEKGGLLEFDSQFLLKSEADFLLEFLRANVPWEQKFYTDRRTGKQIAQPRLTAWYADNSKMAYSYSGVTQVVQHWLPELLELKKKIEVVSRADYNSVLLNFYRDGKDSVWWHADDEKELGENPNIASISLGATRDFGIAEYQNDLGKELYFDLNHGSLLIMSGTTQKYWRHSIPKMPEVKEGRINLTFRKFFA